MVKPWEIWHSPFEVAWWCNFFQEFKPTSKSQIAQNFHHQFSDSIEFGDIIVLTYICKYTAEWSSLTYNQNGTHSNPIPWICFNSRSKALNQCTIQCRGCSTTQCWCEGSSACSKSSSRYGCEGMTSFTWLARSITSWQMWQCTPLPTTIHSPDGCPTHIPSNSTHEGEGITRTGDGSCSELPSYITWRD